MQLPEREMPSQVCRSGGLVLVTASCRKPYDPRHSAIDMEPETHAYLGKSGEPVQALRIGIGSVRSLFREENLFVGALILAGQDPMREEVEVFSVDNEGHARHYPRLQITLVGMLGSGDGESIAYGGREIWKLSLRNGAWEKLQVNAQLVAEPIRAIVRLEGGKFFVFTRMTVIGLGNLDGAPAFSVPYAGQFVAASGGHRSWFLTLVGEEYLLNCVDGDTGALKQVGKVVGAVPLRVYEAKGEALVFCAGKGDKNAERICYRFRYEDGCVGSNRLPDHVMVWHVTDDGVAFVTNGGAVYVGD